MSRSSLGIVHCLCDEKIFSPARDFVEVGVRVSSINYSNIAYMIFTQIHLCAGFCRLRLDV
ncbi:MAG TPA: hypothetical protein ENF55_03790 [Thermoprotei archaeon]|nr:hypothetical protein [Thermoprotei archaeon]